ncbi:MAG: FMN-binding negative transcriptional regulator [Alphaproteobacteria bacterium]|jgi:transcriptional regulator
MYTPSHFEENDRPALYDAIVKNNFGILMSQVEGELIATHLPFMIEDDKLVAHMARANPQWRGFDPATPVLCVFQGPHAYISPSWYESKNMVPTWNYVAIHVSGTPRIIEDPQAVYENQKKQVDFQEGGFETPWRLEDADRSHIDGMLRAIVAFEIPIDTIQGKAKMNQNRSEADQRGAINGLRETGHLSDAMVADYMNQRLTNNK